MRSLNFVIVEVEDVYINKTELEGLGEIYTTSSIEDVKDIKRVAKVVTAPEGTVLRKGDEVVIHHNILRLRNGIKGQVVDSNYYIEENKYFVPLNEVFMYKRNGVWESLNPFVFVKPIPLDDSEDILLGIRESHNGMEKHRGIVSFMNEDLKEQGVNVGDKIIFRPYSEYEFNIDGEIYYKMKSQDIIALL